MLLNFLAGDTGTNIVEAKSNIGAVSQTEGSGRVGRVDSSIGIGVVGRVGRVDSSTRVQKSRISISRPLAKVMVGSICVRGDAIGVRGDTIAVGEGSIGQRRVSASVEKGSIGLRLSISGPLAKVVVSVRGDTIGVGRPVAVGEGSIGVSSIGQRRVSTSIQEGSISISLGLSLSADNSNKCRYNNKEFTMA